MPLLVRVPALLLLILSCGVGQVLPGFGGPGTGQATWYLSGVRFSDGGTASGWLMYDYAALSCSADITTTGGSASPGAHYTSCQGARWSLGGGSFASLSTLPLSVSQFGASVLALFTLTTLTTVNGGGILVLDTHSNEGPCVFSPGPGSGCARYIISRTVVAGAVTTTPAATPAPATLGLSLLGLTTLFVYWALRFRKRERAHI
jgi:hypothetical protein